MTKATLNWANNESLCPMTLESKVFLGKDYVFRLIDLWFLATTNPNQKHAWSTAVENPPTCPAMIFFIDYNPYGHSRSVIFKEDVDRKKGPGIVWESMNIVRELIFFTRSHTADLALRKSPGTKESIQVTAQFLWRNSSSGKIAKAPVFFGV